MGCGTSNPTSGSDPNPISEKVDQNTITNNAEIESRIHKDQQSNVCHLTWQFTAEQANDIHFDLPNGENHSFVFDSFALELQHLSGKIISASILTEDITNEKVNQLNSLFPSSNEKWEDMKENLSKLGRVLKLELQLQKELIEKYIQNNPNVNKNIWTSNAFDKPEKKELQTIWSFKDGSQRSIVNQLNYYEIRKLDIMTLDNRYVGYSL